MAGVKTLDELYEELHSGKRQSIARAEMDAARDHERGLLPAGTRFPRKGDVYEALEDMAVDYVTEWMAPYSGGGKGTLRRGERVKVRYVEAKAVVAYARPLRYKEIEARMVPLAERQEPKYGHFYLYLKTSDLNRRFRLMPWWYSFVTPLFPG